MKLKHGCNPGIRSDMLNLDMANTERERERESARTPRMANCRHREQLTIFRLRRTWGNSRISTFRG